MEAIYNKRHLVVKYIDVRNNLMNVHYYTGYLEILPTDKQELIDLAKNKINSVDFEPYDLFDDFPGGITWTGKLPGSAINNLYIGFDTNHWAMPEYSDRDCLAFLKRTVDKIEKYNEK